jgi:RimJ/RimL family protein N-acetyltransferase
MIETDVLYLKKLKKSDLSFYQRIYTDKKLVKYVCPVLDNTLAENYFKLTLKIMSKPNPKMVLYVIYETKSNNKIGVIGLRWNQKTEDSVEIGIIVLPSRQRKGFAHHAKSSLIEYAFNSMKINSIIANCDEDNEVANLANQKLGFEKVKTFLSEKSNKMTIKWRVKKENSL